MFRTGEKDTHQKLQVLKDIKYLSIPSSTERCSKSRAGENVILNKSCLCLIYFSCVKLWVTLNPLKRINRTCSYWLSRFRPF